jgi:hypothetical protein
VAEGCCPAVALVMVSPGSLCILVCSLTQGTGDQEQRKQQSWLKACNTSVQVTRLTCSLILYGQLFSPSSNALVHSPRRRLRRLELLGSRITWVPPASGSSWV